MSLKIYYKDFYIIWIFLRTQKKILKASSEQQQQGKNFFLLCIPLPKNHQMSPKLFTNKLYVPEKNDENNNKDDCAWIYAEQSSLKKQISIVFIWIFICLPSRCDACLSF